MNVPDPLFYIEKYRAITQRGIDTMIDQMGRNCTVVLPGSPTECPNCKFDPITGRSTGLFKTDGPMEFHQGPCPVCNGSGKDPVSGQDVLVVKKFKITRNLKANWFLGDGRSERPATIASIKVWFDDLPALKAMKFIYLDSDLGYDEKYERYIDPEASGTIVPGRYFKMFLKRI